MVVQPLTTRILIEVIAWINASVYFRHDFRRDGSMSQCDHQRNPEITLHDRWKLESVIKSFGLEEMSQNRKGTSYIGPGMLEIKNHFFRHILYCRQLLLLGQIVTLIEFVFPMETT